MRWPIWGLVLVLTATGCSGGTPSSDPSPPTSTTGETGQGDPAVATTDDRDRQLIESVLRRRARAVVAGDRAAFLGLVARSAAARQRAWFGRVAPLPLASLRYVLGTHDADESDTDTFVADVDEYTRLAGFDPKPVWTTHRMTFVREAGGWRLSRDEIDDSEILAAPWEFPGITVERDDDVLLATDAPALRKAPGMFGMLQEARDYVDGQTEGALGGVVFLAVSDEGALRAEGMNTDELNRVGAVTTGVRGVGFDVVVRRVIVAPAALGADSGYEQVLLRHELVHIALQRYQATSPVWLTEGIAEYVAHEGLPETLPASAIDAARAGTLELAPNSLFYRGDDGDNGPNYAAAWWALKYLASVKGPEEPLRLLEAFRREGRGMTFADMSAFLDDRYGFDADELADRASDLIVDRWAGVDTTP